LRNRSLSSSAGLGTGWGRIGLSSRFESESQPRRRRKTLLDLAHEIASFFADQAQIQAIPNTLRRPNPPYFQALRVFAGDQRQLFPFHFRVLPGLFPLIFDQESRFGPRCLTANIADAGSAESSLMAGEAPAPAPPAFCNDSCLLIIDVEIV
jgi:hypothetical protein